MNYLGDLRFWINERDLIRRRKEAGEPRPWTQDRILNEFRFCNVRREDDKVTKWIHTNWLIPFDGAANLPFAMCVARMVNHPDTLEELGYPIEWDPNHFIDVLSARKSRGEKVWTSAYMITGGYSAGGESKEVIIARVLDQAHSNLGSTHWSIREGDSLATMASKIKCPGIGPFLSAQVVADLKWSSYGINSKDWFTWCAPGPGSMMGLNYMHNRELSQGINEGDFMREVNELRSIVAGWDGPILDAQNMQNCLCELSKYIRATYFGRRLKSRYVPE